MMKYILILLLSLSGALKAQVYTYVEKQPEFPGGQTALSTFIIRNVSYTKADIEKEGPPQTKYLRFVIDSTGNVTTPLIENRDSTKYTPYEKRLIEMVLKMPKWIPGEQNKKKVAVSFMLPVRLALQED
jgi:periplasmic protein TonB